MGVETILKTTSAKEAPQIWTVLNAGAKLKHVILGAAEKDKNIFRNAAVIMCSESANARDFW